MDDGTNQSLNGVSASNGVSNDASRKSSIAQKWKVGAKEALLMWCRNNSKVQVQNFGKSWRDGRAFIGVVSSILPSNYLHKQTLQIRNNN